MKEFVCVIVIVGSMEVFRVGILEVAIPAGGGGGFAIVVAIVFASVNSECYFASME